MVGENFFWRKKRAHEFKISPLYVLPTGLEYPKGGGGRNLTHIIKSLNLSREIKQYF